MDCLTLTCGCRGRPVQEQVIDVEPFGMSMVGVQRVDQRWPFLDEPYSRVTVAVDPPLVPLRQAKPTLQIEVVQDVIQVVPAQEQAGTEALHQSGHVVMRRIAVAAQACEDRVKAGLTRGGVTPGGIQGRSDLRDRLGVTPDPFLLGLHQGQPRVDARGQSSQLRLREPPFFASKFRWIDARISSRASAICNPGGWSGPPWSLLRMPRTAAQ
jgi:hypothetical protein